MVYIDIFCTGANELPVRTGILSDLCYQRYIEEPVIRAHENATRILAHVGKYDRADDRPKLAMLAANVDYRYWTDDRSRFG